MSVENSFDQAIQATVDRAPRERVLLSAAITTFGGNNVTKHRVRDISATGARIDLAQALTPGATVLVAVGQLEAVGATVMWKQQDIAGLKFAQPINPDAARSNAVLPPRKRESS